MDTKRKMGKRIYNIQRGMSSNCLLNAEKIGSSKSVVASSLSILHSSVLKLLPSQRQSRDSPCRHWEFQTLP